VGLSKEAFGRFGTTEYTEYGEIEIGKEYLVMGMILLESHLAYLVDSNAMVSACPCQLFEINDSTLSPNWHFRVIGHDESMYPFIQAIWGYYELCFDKNAYEKLIVEQDSAAIRLYFNRKLEFEELMNGRL
jgi:hypothetical protein